MQAVRNEDIAIIGLSGRFPGAKTVEDFWLNLCQGRESIHYFSDQELQAAGVSEQLYKQKNYVKAKGIVDEVAYFDAAFFGLSALEAQILDPQHRLFLLCAWEALENAGIALKPNKNRVGVFASTGMSFYLLKHILSDPELLKNVDDYQLLMSNDKDFLATRLSYLFNLQGPSVNLQTGCSSSLVSVHYACQSLLNGECDMALAGGVSLTIPQEQGYLYQKEMIGSPDGHCYAFDGRAQGTVKSNGVGVVLLKPLNYALRDQDPIYAVIRATAVNNDGANKVGYTAPSVSQQSAVIREAMQMADVMPHWIEYIETHGTGTLLGDPIEVAALTQAFATAKHQPSSCALTSLKTNIGHLDVAAGVAGLIKASLAVYHGKIPASLNFSELNPKINLDNTPFYINTQLKEWKSQQPYRYAGVSAFGIGGTNAHVVLQQAPTHHQQEKSDREASHLLFFSAKSPASLLGNVKKMASYLQANPNIDLADVAYTLQHGRAVMPYRMALSVSQVNDVVLQAESLSMDGLTPVTTTPSIVFMFSGQGSQYPGMAAQWYATDEAFKNALDECLAALKPHMQQDLRQCIFPTTIDASAHERLKQTEITQPALFAIEYALAQSYLAKGVKPAAVMGHSIGEYAAAVIAGIFSLNDAAKLIARRGQLIQSLPAGSMLAVFQTAEKLAPILTKNVDIALINALNITVVAGPTSAIEDFSLQLQQLGIQYQPLHTSHAFHSSMLDTILPEFAQTVASTQRNAPTLSMASNVTGDWLTAEQACSVQYWVDQMRQTVKFVNCIASIEKKLSPYFIELGPGRTLQQLVYQQGIKKAWNSLPTANEATQDKDVIMKTLAALWNAGVPVKMPVKGKRIRLPTYAWDLQRYWIENRHPQQANIPVPVETPSVNVDIKSQIQTIWSAVLGVPLISDEDHFFNLGGNSFTAIQFINRLPATWLDKVTVVHLYQYPKFIRFVEFLESIVCENDEMNERELFSAQGEL